MHMLSQLKKNIDMKNYTITGFNQISWVRCLIIWHIVTALLCVTGCTEDKEPVSELNTVTANVQTTRKEADLLTLEQAKQRKSQVEDIGYVLYFDLTRTGNDFTGKVEINFSLLDKGQPLTIDFSGGTVSTVNVNGDNTAVNYNGYFLTIADNDLKIGSNVIEIYFDHPYSTDGTGLHRFTDPGDGHTYLYTYLWPYYANRLFPNFDQPDLKATYTLSVKAPTDWLVSSATREIEIREEGKFRLWLFPQSLKFSTYIFSLHAGPYKVWEAEAEDIPLRLFARQSLAEHVAYEEWFTFTRQGLAFYRDYFDIPYPFAKYDQLIVPDFLIGAMENVAAVTFAERYVQRSDSTRNEREARASVILHEMAHMWFGDLVTKKWWDALWLNESFATYMSYLAVLKATEFKDASHQFFLLNKFRAYEADQKVTTHPIQVPIPDTGNFFTVFDRITYDKGSSVLKQLAHSLGDDVFQTGVSQYLKKYSFSNTTLDDFMGALENAANTDLQTWTNQWLYKAGVNRIQARFECVDNKVSEFYIDQSASKSLPYLRQHQTQIGLYGPGVKGNMTVQSILPVTLNGANTTITTAIGLPCPKLVYPNHYDWDYARVLLDKRTLTALKTDINSFKDPLTRSMFWASLRDLTFEGELAITEFIDLALNNIDYEQNARVIKQVLDALGTSVYFLNRWGEASQSVRDTYLPRIENLLWTKIEAAIMGSDLQKLWFDHFVMLASTTSAKTRLQALLKDELLISGMVLDQDRRWRVIVRLNSMNMASAEALSASELKKDPSDLGKKMAIAAEAARPELTIKNKWLAIFHDPASSESFAKQRFAMNALFPSHQTKLQTQVLDDILEALTELSKDRDAYYLSSYTSAMLRGLCDKESVTKMASVLQAEEDLHPTVVKFLREAHQSTQQCIELAGKFKARF